MSEKNIVKAAGAVSIGSLAVQAGGVVGQFIYAIWLTPADFGLWATASAAMALVGSLMNGGEANAYLSGQLIGINGPFKRSGRFNLILAVIGILITLVFVFSDQVEVAVLLVVLACGVPLQGRGAMLIAVFIKVRSQTKLVSFQVIATLARLIVGITVAYLWQNPLALALAYVAYSSVLVLLGQLWLKRSAPHLMKIASPSAGTRSLRFDRAIHQFSQTLPSQIDYLVIAVLASPQVLGLYFFAYQATSALSAVISSPLSKATMSELSQVDKAQRMPIVFRFLMLIVALVGLLAMLVSLIIQPLSGILGGRWVEVLAPLIVLLSSLPARFVIPITEALNLVNAKWRRSMWINMIDAAGIGAAAYVALILFEGDVVTLAASISLWKVAFGNTRALLVLRGYRLRATFGIVLPNTLFLCITVVSLNVFGYLTWFAGAAMMTISLCLVIAFAGGRVRSIVPDSHGV